MKKVLGLCLVATLASACGQAGAERRTQPAHGFRPGAIAFWDSRHGLALFGSMSQKPAARDALEATSDGGRSWRRLRSVPRGSELVAAGESRAWLLTASGLSRSGDRGVTWKRVSVYPLDDVSFATARDGIGYGVVRGHELLAATHDGGRTWQRRSFPCRDDGDADGDDRVSLAAPNLVWVLCVSEPGAGSQPKRLYRSTDDGRSWVRRTATGVGYLMGFAFRGSQRGWLWERRGWFLRTDDGGRTWSALRIGKPEENEAESVSFFDSRRGLALFHESGRRLRLRLMRTQDSGRTWLTVRDWTVVRWTGI